jgi:hypothetical protein
MSKTLFLKIWDNTYARWTNMVKLIGMFNSVLMYLNKLLQNESSNVWRSKNRKPKYYPFKHLHFSSFPEKPVVSLTSTLDF